MASSKQCDATSSPDSSVQVFNNIRTGLRRVTDDKTATKYALFAQEVYVYIQCNPDVQAAIKEYKDWKDGREVGEGVDKVRQANKYLRNAKDVGTKSAVNGFKRYRARRSCRDT